MKILLINKFLHPNGGSETYIFKLGEYLKSIGHEVQYFGMEHPARIVGNKVNSYTENVDYHNSSALKKLTLPIKTIYSHSARQKLRSVLNDFKPDVCHLNNFNYQLTPSIILEIKKWRKQSCNNCKIFYTAHDYQLICPNHMLYNPTQNKICEKCLGGKFSNCAKQKCIHGSFLRSVIGSMEAYFWNAKKVYNNFDKVICCSAFIKTKLDTNPAFNGKTVVMHNFVEKPRLCDVTKKDYVLYFGRFSEEKGVKTLVEVCKRLPQINFVFAGSGKLENLLNDLPNIKNVGFKTGVELENLIKDALLTVYPAEWYENCPFSVIESQIYGTPIIAANIGGIPELISDGKTGELFDSGNADMLYEKILSFTANKDKQKEYFENCKNAEFVSTKEYVDNLLKLYNQ